MSTPAYHLNIVDPFAASLEAPRPVDPAWWVGEKKNKKNGWMSCPLFELNYNLTYCTVQY